MNPMTYMFWDTETIGLDRAFHVPVEIGAVVTDHGIRPLRETSLSCRPPSSLLADPGGLITTGRGWAEVQNRTLSSYAAICQFASVVEAASPTCFVSYNGIRFDDPLIQHSFFRHLHDPYLMMKAGNCRLDLLNVLRFAHAIGCGFPAVPVTDAGLPVFKLDRLAPLNGFEEPGAHSALVDARAVRHLAGGLAARAPEVWRRASTLWSQKHALRQLLSDNGVVLAFDWNGPRGVPIFKALMPIGFGRGYAGECVCVDLAFDPETYSALSPQELTDHITVGSKPRPICPVRLNASPIVLSVHDELAKGHVPIDAGVLAQRVARLRSDTGLRERILDAANVRRTSFPVPPMVEQQLYSGGFISDYDAIVACRFHQAPPEKKSRVLATFTDARLRYFGERIIYEEWPDLLDDQTRIRIAEQVRTRHLADARAPWTTIASALRNIEKLLPGADDCTRQILIEYRVYLIGLHPDQITEAAA